MSEHTEAEVCTIDTSRFLELGLSPELILHIDAKRYPRPLQKKFKLGMVLVALGMTALFMLLVWGNIALQAYLKAERTRGLSAFHYDPSYGPSLIVGLFAMIFLTALIHGRIQESRPSEVRDFELLSGLAAGANTSGLNGHLTRRLYRWLFSNMPQMPVSQQIAYLQEANLRMYKGPLKWLVGAFLVFSYLDTQNFSLATQEGLVTHNYWTTEKVASPWAKLQAVRVGCWITDKNALSLYYVAAFENGTEINLLDANPQGHDFALAEFVEALLPARATPKSFALITWGIHKGQPRAHERCAETIEARYPEEIVRKLHVLLTFD